MTVLPLLDADGRRPLVPAVIVRRRSIVAPVYGDPVHDARYRAVFERGLSKLLAGVLPPTRGPASRDPSLSAPRSVMATAAATSACDDATHAESPGAWPGNHYAWRWNAKSFGSAEHAERPQARARAVGRDVDRLPGLQGHHLVHRQLRRHDHTARGRERRGEHGRQGRPLKSSCGAPAIACTWVWRVDDDYTETDTRFADDVKWSNKGAAGAYDYQGIAAHEFGHSIGLSDLDESGKLTMYFQGTLGYTGQRTLGRGDILGARAIYGG